jgi:hypothetical protein
MKNKLKFLFCLILFCSISPCFCQNAFLCKGTVTDSKTREIIQDVRIYVDKDTVGTKTNVAGEFQIIVKSGSNVHFRKPGYIWQNIAVVGANNWKILLSPSLPKNMGNRNSGINELFVNGKPLPENEWNDINPDDITDISVSLSGEITRMSITTK